MSNELFEHEDFTIATSAARPATERQEVVNPSTDNGDVFTVSTVSARPARERQEVVNPSSDNGDD